ncbi:MAG: hypothetical protein ACJA0N_000948 [Pseudohongiellaceae bacterium]|jgi:hypothetical protein
MMFAPLLRRFQHAPRFIVLIAVLLLGAVQLEAVHTHGLHDGIECALHAGGFSVDEAVPVVIDPAALFLLTDVVSIAATFFIVAVPLRYSARAPPLFSQ